MPDLVHVVMHCNCEGDWPSSVHRTQAGAEEALREYAHDLWQARDLGALPADLEAVLSRLEDLDEHFRIATAELLD